jgi:hypothetical protein
MRGALESLERFVRWVGLAAWIGAVGALVWYAVVVVTAPWQSASILAAMAIGVLIGMYVTPRWLSLAFLPLIAFSVGGYLLSTQFSNTHGYAGGDWSVAAIVVVCGVVDGLVATVAVLATLLARPPLRAVIRRSPPIGPRSRSKLSP